MITAVVDIRDSNGNSLVPQDSDGTKPVKIVQLGVGMTATYARSGDFGVVTIAATSAVVTPAAVLAALTAVPAGTDVEIVAVTNGMQTSPGLAYDHATPAWRVGDAAGVPNTVVLSSGQITLHLQHGGGAGDVDALVVDNNSGAGPARIGVLGAAPAARQVVTGSKASGAALVSLLAALVAFGWITDSTSA